VSSLVRIDAPINGGLSTLVPKPDSLITVFANGSGQVNLNVPGGPNSYGPVYIQCVGNGINPKPVSNALKVEIGSP
jgi:hypothetical protein